MRTHWDMVVDVVVLGSGGSALTAAILAHDGGATTVVLEKAPVVGGTTAMSGGMLWIPLNRHQRELEIPDSREEALLYMKTYAGELGDEALIEAFLDAGPEMIDYLEEHTPVKFETHELFPDYHPELPGGRAGGRSLDAALFSFKQLGDWAARVNPPVATTIPATFGEVARHGGRIDPALIAQRQAEDVRAAGNGLIGALLLGCLQRGIEVLTETPGRELVMDGRAVAGVVAERDARDFAVRTRKAVILGTGGFEWNPGLVKSFLRGPMTGPGSTPENEGDGLIMAMAAGASLGLMGEAWWMPTIRIPGEELRGRQVYRLAAGGERAYPGSIMVNRNGQRFVNEACNYSTLGRALHEYETSSTTFGLKNVPCWLIFDQQYQDRYPMRQRGPGGEGGGHTLVPVDGERPPGWVTVAPKLEALATKIGIEPGALVATVSRFNDHARAGRDPDFHRGESAYDNFMGDRSLPAPFSTLGPVERAPFYAVELQPGTIGTKGGPRTNADAQVLDLKGEPIPGLYAVGNTMASASGLAYFGAGTTIGMGMTFGYLAGKAAAREPSRG